jgi:hypothetical protein
MAQHGISRAGGRSIDEQFMPPALLPGPNLFSFYAINAKSTRQRKQCLADCGKFQQFVKFSEEPRGFYVC